MEERGHRKGRGGLHISHIPPPTSHTSSSPRLTHPPLHISHIPPPHISHCTHPSIPAMVHLVLAYITRAAHMLQKTFIFTDVINQYYIGFNNIRTPRNAYIIHTHRQTYIKFGSGIVRHTDPRANIRCYDKVDNNLRDYNSYFFSANLC